MPCDPVKRLRFVSFFSTGLTQVWQRSSDLPSNNIWLMETPFRQEAYSNRRKYLRSNYDAVFE
jgi:hypothetical protein